jgi:hypothetical protein
MKKIEKNQERKKRRKNQPGTDDMFFLNIFAENFGKKIGVFYSKLSYIMQKFHHDIGFREKRQFVRRKLPKIAENCDHNIDLSIACEFFYKNDEV